MKIVALIMAMVAGSAFAGDYLVIGHEKLFEGKNRADLVKKFTECLPLDGGNPASVKTVHVTDSAALRAQAGRSFDGVVLVPTMTGEGDKRFVSTNDLAVMKAFLASAKVKSAVAVEEGGSFANFRTLQTAFKGVAGVITLRDGDARLISFWGNYAPVGVPRIVRALALAADPARRDFLSPIPARITLENGWAVVDFDSPALAGKSIVIGDTLFRKFYVASRGRANWNRIDNVHVEGNRIYLDCSKVKDPGRVMMNWWHIGPVLNADGFYGPAFEMEITR